MFVDRVRIHVKGGDGGNGCSKSSSEQSTLLHGGPDGGDGGKGGERYFRRLTRA